MRFIKRLVAKLVGLGFLGNVGKYLNGKKTILGAISLLIYVLEIAPTFIPECGPCPQIAAGIQQVLEFLGVGLVSLGLAHKAVK